MHKWKCHHVSPASVALGCLCMSSPPCYHCIVFTPASIALGCLHMSTPSCCHCIESPATAAMCQP
eukprot:709412-Pelagomonas_calceolata.AAC.2